MGHGRVSDIAESPTRSPGNSHQGSGRPSASATDGFAASYGNLNIFTAAN